MNFTSDTSRLLLVVVVEGFKFQPIWLKNDHIVKLDHETPGR